jgi:hypothetical protein
MLAVVIGCTALSLLFSLFLLFKKIPKELPVLSGKISNKEYQRRYADYFDGYEAINTHLRKGNKVLLIKGFTENGLVRYFVDAECMLFMPRTPEHSGFIYSLSDPNNFLEECRNKGFTHIFDILDPGKEFFLSGAIWDSLRGTQTLESIVTGDNWKLYKISPGPRSKLLLNKDMNI